MPFLAVLQDGRVRVQVRQPAGNQNGGWTAGWTSLTSQTVSEPRLAVEKCLAVEKRFRSPPFLVVSLSKA